MTPEEPLSPQETLARARAARVEIAATLEEDQAPEPGESGWEPIWKRPREVKSKAAREAELRTQRERLLEAGRRRLAAGLSRRPRPVQDRIGSAAARRDARALSRMRNSVAWKG